ncbi:aspartate carbamoyltransferase catalytic subunit, partial [Rhizobium sp. CRIBSB]|nr:aspartate carbamoyltransferase catalytic subunit [Rhizobium sp. CRIBSB]
MTQPDAVTDLIRERLVPFPKRHFLSAADLNPPAALALLDLADVFVDLNRSSAKALDLMHGQTVVNLFFENSTRTSSSFEIAAKRLGADVVTMPVQASSVKKGETLIDTAVTLNAMKPDILVIRHSGSGAADLLSQKVGCSVINAGDGRHEHPTQALLDLLSLR